MSRRLLDYCVAAIVFLVALGLYGLTAAPTVSFWDAGEFIASAYTLQVNHPPGAPLYLLVSRVASLVVPPEHVALAVNMVSVTCSALTVLLTHLIIVRLVRRWNAGGSASRNAVTALPALGGGAVGALTLATADSFWFNAVEAEVYAFASLLTATVCWLALRWSAAVDRDALRKSSTWAALRSHRYLVLIAFLFGLSIGVHLLSLLAFFFVGVIVYLTAFESDDEPTRRRWIRRAVAGGIIGISFLVLYPGIVKGIPALIDASGAPVLVLLGTASVVGTALYGSARWGWSRLHLATLCVAAVLVGYSAYALVPLRSATDPPIDIGDPETTDSFVSYLNRAQYGSTPLLSGRTFNDETGRVRRHENTTMFPRRHSLDRSHWRVYQQYDSDWDFFWQYQVGHMYLRYLMWNFAGKSSDVQNAPARTGLAPLDRGLQPVEQTLRTPSEQESRNVYYALPLFLGLLGAWYHFWRDQQSALAVGTLFLATGLGIVFYLNQTPMQPRPRDYSFVGNFFALSLWVGLGAAGILDSVRTWLGAREMPAPSIRASCGLILTLLLVLVPGQMLRQNYGDHDRSGRQDARDFAYNMLTSVAEDSILFTYGDNDTYPLWYLQNVEGVRPDVRVVNLSLLGTPWYAKQLKERSNESAPLPMSLTDEQIDRLAYRAWKPRTVRLPVDRASLLSNQPALRKSLGDGHSLETPMRWRLRGRAVTGGQRALSVTNQVVYNILRKNAEQGWKRPVYFSVTTPPSTRLNLERHLQIEGLAHRVVPIQHNGSGARVVPGLSEAPFADFRLTNLDDPDVFYGDTSRGTIGGNYRVWPARVARGLAQQGYEERARALLDRFTRRVPLDLIPADSSIRIQLAHAYQAADAPEQATSVARATEPLVLEVLRSATRRPEIVRALRAAGSMRTLYRELQASTALDRFDSQLTAALDVLSMQIPSEARRRLNLPVERSGG